MTSSDLGPLEMQAQLESYPKSQLRFGRIEETRTQRSLPAHPFIFPRHWDGGGVRQELPQHTTPVRTPPSLVPSTHLKDPHSPTYSSLGFRELQESLLSFPFFLRSCQCVCYTQQALGVVETAISISQNPPQAWQPSLFPLFLPVRN